MIINYSHIMDEWHPTKNKDINPSTLSTGSGKRIYFICKNKHEYSKSIRHRFLKKADGSYPGCPYCNDRKIHISKSLLELYPKIAKEWHPTKNKKRTPADISPGNTVKKFWWLCMKGHSYQMKVFQRTGVKYTHKNKQGCSICNSFGSLYPEEAKEFHPTLNGDKTPFDFKPKSGYKVWWLCKKGHKFKKPISSRANGSRCNICFGGGVDNKNNLAILYPKIAKLWHPIKNGRKKPEHYRPYSNKKFYWMCLKGHKPYKATIESLTRSKYVCPKCTKQSSSHEYRILAECSAIFNNIKSRYKIDGIEIDVFIEDINLAIEFDGWYFHKNKFEKDIEKNKCLKKLNIQLIRFREVPLKITNEKDIQIERDNLKKSDINNLFSTIFSSLSSKYKNKINKYLLKKSFVKEKLYNKYLSYFPSPLPQHSLENNFPELIKIWDYNKNYPLEPKNFMPGSNFIAWWICHDCKNSYQHPIKNKSLRNWGCPYCKGAHKTSRKESLLYKYPDISKEWHPTKNGSLSPLDVVPGSARKVWWICPKGHSYQKIIRHRAQRNQRKCLVCRDLQ